MITYNDIAEVVGVSRSTVANILNGTPHYKKETREKVLKAAAQLGYQPNRASHTIRRGRSNLIGVIHSGSAFEVGQLAVYALLQEISQHNYDYHVVDLHWHAGDGQRVINEMVQARVEGVVLCADVSPVFDAGGLDILRRARIPVVSMYGEHQLHVPVVGDSTASSFYSLTRHLQKIEHQSILLLAYPRQQIPFRSIEGRIRGFETAVKGWGECLAFEEKAFIREWPRLHTEYRDRCLGVIVYLDQENAQWDAAQRTRQCCHGILASGAIPDAIMATNDRAAYGAFSAAHELGIRVPSGLAITGSDDDVLSGLPLFGLTTIRQDVPRFCVATVEMLLARMGKKPEVDEDKEQSFPSQLVLRSSCGRRVGEKEDAVVYRPTEPCPPDDVCSGVEGS